MNLESKVPDWEAVMDHIAKEGTISKDHFVKMLNDVMDIFSKY